MTSSVVEFNFSVKVSIFSDILFFSPAYSCLISSRSWFFFSTSWIDYSVLLFITAISLSFWVRILFYCSNFSLNSLRSFEKRSFTWSAWLWLIDCSLWSYSSFSLSWDIRVSHLCWESAKSCSSWERMLPWRISFSLYSSCKSSISSSYLFWSSFILCS